MPSLRWIRYSALNFIEHGLTRLVDIAFIVLILRQLPTENVSKLLLAQAVVAPFLFLFLPPTTILYREFSDWKKQPGSFFVARLRLLRRYGWCLGLLALVLSFILSTAVHAASGYAFLWAFAYAPGGNIFVTDRELLRLELDFKALNWITVYQKLSLLAVGALVSFRYPDRLDFLAFGTVLSMITTAWIAHAVTHRRLVRDGVPPLALREPIHPPFFKTLGEMFTRFSGWNHVAGVIWLWIQSMDLFFLGLFRYPALTVGLYGAALKIANFSFAIPVALGNLFAVWVGRRSAGDPNEEKHEKGKLSRLSLLLFAGCLLQAAILYALSPYLISFLSKGRWSELDQRQIRDWLGWILAGSVIMGSTFLLNWWATLRAPARELFFRAYLPWLVCSLAVYAGAARWGGPEWSARANLAVAALYLGLLGSYSLTSRSAR